MNKNTVVKRNNEVKILLGIITFVIMLTFIASSYAFFNYTKTGNTASVGTGYVKFNFNDGSSEISKGNAFPIENDDIDNTITKTFNLTGHTTYEEGLKYSIYIVYGDSISGKTRLRDDVISLQFIPVADANGFTTEINNYSNPSSLTFNNGKALISTGSIKDTTQLTTKSGYTIKLWIDSSKMNVSSTTKRTTNAEGNPSLADSTSGTTTATRYTRNNTAEGTTVTLYPATTNQQGKIIYTTNEFSNSFYSFKIVVEAEEYIPPICRRVTDATKLHTETCSQTSNYCAGDGYTGSNTTITYGNAKLIGNNTLTAGDAFDCDVNGNGVVDVDGSGNSTERFYYVSEYYNTDTKAFDTGTGYATLIYYKNFVSGSPSDGAAAYATAADIQAIDSNATSYDNWHGPVTAVTHLPTTSTWSNITLKTTSRIILACDNGDCSNTPVLTTNKGSNTITNPFSYEGKAARLLTVQEIKHAGCDTLSSQASLTTAGALKACNFLFEGTKYANSSKATNGPWLETPNAYYSDYVWFADVESRYVNDYPSRNSSLGVRPAIDVPFSRMQY